MREIKFRAYEKDESIEFTLKEAIFRSYPDPFIESVDSPIVQYTGLKDKYGKEIYEGDIVRVDNDWDKYGMTAGESYEIYFNEGGFRLKAKYNKNARGYWLEDNNEFEIIGNIFENKNLLK